MFRLHSANYPHENPIRRSSMVTTFRVASQEIIRRIASPLRKGCLSRRAVGRLIAWIGNVDAGVQRTYAGTLPDESAE